MRVSAKRVARAVFEATRAHKERMLASPAIVVHSTPEQFAVGTFYYTIAGTTYAKAAATAIPFSAAHTIEQGKYGAALLEISTAGAIATRIGEATQTTMQSYSTAAAAIAALPTVATASKRIIGRVVILAKNKYATLSTNLTGNNNDLVFTSVATGTAGNAVTVAYIDPSANDAELEIVVDGTDIVVNLATDNAGVITTTGDDIKAAILESEEASALVTVADKAANDGSGVVTALTETALSGGTATGWTAITDDMVADSDVQTVTITNLSGSNEVLSNIGDSWVEKTPAFQEERAAEVKQYLWTGVVPTLDATVDKVIFLAVVDSLRNRATPV